MVVMEEHQRGRSGRERFLYVTARASTILPCSIYANRVFPTKTIALVSTRFGSLDFLLATLWTILHLGGIDIVVDVADGFDALAEASRD